MVGFRWEFGRTLPWGVLYLISKFELSFLYLTKLINLIKILIKHSYRTLIIVSFSYLNVFLSCIVSVVYGVF